MGLFTTQLNDAAVSAGFPSRSEIGNYLRSLMSHHRDTLAGAVN